MSELADLSVGRCAAIDFCNDRLRRWIAHIVKPGLYLDIAGAFRKIAKSHEVSVHRGIGPGDEAKFGGNAGLRLRIEAGTDDIEDAAESEIVAHYLREKHGVRLRGVGTRREIGHGDARLFDAKAGASAKPVLLL